MLAEKNEKQTCSDILSVCSYISCRAQIFFFFNPWFIQMLLEVLAPFLQYYVFQWSV